MGETVYQIHLAGPGFSGRGVRYRVLSPSEADQCTLDAAKQIGPEGTVLELRAREGREGVLRMLIATTDAYVEAGKLDSATWRVVDKQKLSVDAAYDAFFTSKDDDALVSLFRRKHKANPTEIDAILGKETAVEQG